MTTACSGITSDNYYSTLQQLLPFVQTRDHAFIGEYEIFVLYDEIAFLRFPCDRRKVLRECVFFSR
jgi:hypothetical protein